MALHGLSGRPARRRAALCSWWGARRRTGPQRPANSSARCHPVASARALPGSCRRLADETLHHRPTRLSTVQHGTRAEPMTVQHNSARATTARHGGQTSAAILPTSRSTTAQHARPQLVTRPRQNLGLCSTYAYWRLRPVTPSSGFHNLVSLVRFQPGAPVTAQIAQRLAPPLDLAALGRSHLLERRFGLRCSGASTAAA